MTFKYLRYEMYTFYKEIKTKKKKTRPLLCILLSCILKVSFQTQRITQVYSRQRYVSLGFPVATLGIAKSANDTKVYMNKTLPHLLTFVPEPHQIYFIFSVIPVGFTSPAKRV